MLALSPHGLRTRAWLQDKLWGSRAPMQARSSLRRELANLRAVLAEAGVPILRCEEDRVGLLLGDVEIDALEAAETDAPLNGESLLEGMDIAGEEGFEDWLREQRLRLERAPPPARAASIGPVVASLPTAPRAVDPAVVRLALMPVAAVSPKVALLAAGECLLDRLVNTLNDHGGVKIFDHRRLSLRPSIEDEAPDALLTLRAQGGDDTSILCLQLVHASDGRVLMGRTLRLDAETGLDALAERPLQAAVVCRLAEEILRSLAADAPSRATARHLAIIQVRAAIHKMFGAGTTDVEGARRCLDRATSLLECGVFHAWHAYLGAFALDPMASVGGSTKHRSLRDETREHARRALELDPQNPLTLALLAHAYGFVLRDLEEAGRLLSIARSSGADHIMLHDSEALHALYTGELARAYRSALRAEELGRCLPYRYCFETTLLMLESLRGDFAGAIRHGEASIRLRDNGQGSPYPPTLRYLGASYAMAGNSEAAESTFARLREIEPDLSSAKVDDPGYPLPSGAARELVRSALERTGS